MKTQSMIRCMLVIVFGATVGLWLISTLRSCTRETLAEVEARTREAIRLVESAKRALQGVFGTGVRIDSHGVVHMPRDIAELAVLEHDVSVTSRFTKARVFGWFASTLAVTGTYRGKLGVDLEEVKGRFDREAGVLELELPPVKLLSVETVGLWQDCESRSWFTPIAPHDVLELVRRNREDARQQLKKGRLLEGANQRLRQRLHEALRAVGVTLRVEEPAG